MAKGTSPRRACSSGTLPRLRVARTSGLEREDALVTRGTRLALERDQAEAPLPGQIAQRAADQPLDLLRAAAGAPGLARAPRVGRAREHRVLRRHPAQGLALEEGRDLVLDRGRADHLGHAELHEDGALGMNEIVPRDR